MIRARRLSVGAGGTGRPAAARRSVSCEERACSTAMLAAVPQTAGSEARPSPAQPSQAQQTHTQREGGGGGGGNTCGSQVRSDCIGQAEGQTEPAAG